MKLVFEISQKYNGMKINFSCRKDPKCKFLKLVLIWHESLLRSSSRVSLLTRASDGGGAVPFQIEFAGPSAAFPRPIDKKMCVPIACKFGMHDDLLLGPLLIFPQWFIRMQCQCL